MSEQLYFFKFNKEIEGTNFDDKTHEEMRNYGLDLIYEIPSKTPVRNFHELLGEYEFLTNQEIHHVCGSN